MSSILSLARQEPQCLLCGQISALLVRHASELPLKEEECGLFCHVGVGSFHRHVEAGKVYSPPVIEKDSRDIPTSTS